MSFDSSNLFKVPKLQLVPILQTMLLYASTPVYLSDEYTALLQPTGT